MSTPLTPQPAASLELTILMPCLNEARTLGTCVGKALAFMQQAGISEVPFSEQVASR